MSENANSANSANSSTPAPAQSGALPPEMSVDKSLEISAQPGSEMPPHGIRGPAQKEANYELLAVSAIALLLLIFISYLLVVRRRKKTKEKSKAAPIDPAKALIDQVRSTFPQPGFSPGEQEFFFYHLSSRLRLLIEHVTKIPAAEATMRELRKLLAEGLPLGDPDRAAVIAFLERADQIKYAGTRTDIGEAEEAREKVLQWMLQLTRTP